MCVDLTKIAGLENTKSWVDSVDMFLDSDSAVLYQQRLYMLIRDAETGVYFWTCDEFEVNRYLNILCYDGFTTTSVKNIRDKIMMQARMVNEKDVVRNTYLTKDGYYIDFSDDTLKIYKQTKDNMDKFVVNRFDCNYEITEDDEGMFNDFITKFCSGHTAHGVKDEVVLKENILYVAQLCAAMHFKLQDNITWFYGPSAGNGKSTILNMSVEITNNSAVLDTDKLNTDFALTNAVNKTLLAADELKDISAQTVQTLKKLSGGGKVRINQKFGSVVEDTTPRNIIVTSQFTPAVKDVMSDDGFVRRLYACVCLYKFTGGGNVRELLVHSQAVKTRLLRFIIAGLKAYEKAGSKINIPEWHSYEIEALVEESVDDDVDEIYWLLDNEPEIGGTINYLELAHSYEKTLGESLGFDDRLRRSSMAKKLKRYWSVKQLRQTVDGSRERVYVYRGRLARLNNVIKKLGL